MHGPAPIKTDAIDLEAMTELLLAGHGHSGDWTASWCSVNWRRGRRTGPAG